MLGDSRQFLLEWNENFPLDHWWRKKYLVPFNSSKHRAVSYVDMFYDWLEEQMFDHYIEQSKEEDDKYLEYKKTGKWLNNTIKNTEQKEKMSDLFDNIDISGFNEHLIEEEKEDQHQLNG